MEFENRGHKINYLLSQNKKYRRDIFYLLNKMKDNEVDIGRLYWEDKKELEDRK